MNYQKEYDRLCKLYPLFELSAEELENSEVNLEVKLSKGSKCYYRFNEYGRLDNSAMRELDHDHMKASLDKELRSQYPDLYISTYPNKDGLSISVWVKEIRDGIEDDGTAIGSIELTDVNLRETLAKWQKEASISKQSDWFFCSGHQKAEPKIDYEYYYFAGRYCKEWAESNPQHRKKASLETYN